MTNQSPNRLARWVFRIGVAVCVLIVVATVVSCGWGVEIVYAGWAVSLETGSVTVWPDPDQRVWVAEAGGYLSFWYTKWQRSGRSRGPWLTIRSYPTWIFLLAAMIPTVLAWERLYRYPPGHCQNCGYNLTGNVSGKCSECGTAIEAEK